MVRDLVLNLLTEKLLDEFYACDVKPPTACDSKNELLEKLKSYIPKNQWDLLYDLEDHTVSVCAVDLRRFATFVAGLMLDHAQECGEKT